MSFDVPINNSVLFLAPLGHGTWPLLNTQLLAFNKSDSVKS